MPLKQKETDYLVSLFAGACFFLASIELIIPKPVPFFRIGLANLPILLGINIFSFPTFLFLLLTKVFGQALISGTIFSYITLFSVVSTLSSGLIMYSMKNISKKKLSFIGISVTGAFISTLTQFLLAIFMIFGKAAIFVIPPMLIAGIITSILLGVFANEFTENSTWYKNIIENKFEYKPFALNKNITINKKENYFRISSGILLFLLLFFINFLPIKALILGVSLILCVVDKQKINFIQLLSMFFAIILFNLFPPTGKIILAIGRFNITNEALLRGLQKAIILQSMIYISKWILKTKIEFKTNLGKSIQSAMTVFSKLAKTIKEVKFKNLISNLDAILLSVNKL